MVLSTQDYSYYSDDNNSYIGESYLHTDDIYIDEEGYYVDANGYYVDENGYYINEYGQYVTEGIGELAGKAWNATKNFFTGNFRNASMLDKGAKGAAKKAELYRGQAAADKTLGGAAELNKKADIAERWSKEHASNAMKQRAIGAAKIGGTATALGGGAYAIS